MPSCVRMSVCAPALRVLFGFRLEVTFTCCFVVLSAFVDFTCTPGDAVGTRGKRFVSERTANMLQRCFASLHLALDHIMATQPCIRVCVSVPILCTLLRFCCDAGFLQEHLNEIDDAIDGIQFQVSRQVRQVGPFFSAACLFAQFASLVLTNGSHPVPVSRSWTCLTTSRTLTVSTRGKVTAQQFAQALDMSRVTLLERQVRACLGREAKESCCVLPDLAERRR